MASTGLRRPQLYGKMGKTMRARELDRLAAHVGTFQTSFPRLRHRDGERVVRLDRATDAERLKRVLELLA
jgi:hypothetical protein